MAVIFMKQTPYCVPSRFVFSRFLYSASMISISKSRTACHRMRTLMRISDEPFVYLLHLLRLLGFIRVICFSLSFGSTTKAMDLIYLTTIDSYDLLFLGLVLVPVPTSNQKQVILSYKRWTILHY